MQVRTVLAVLAGMLLLLATVPQDQRPDPADVAIDGHGEASPAMAVDREGPQDDAEASPRDRGPTRDDPGASTGEEAPDAAHGAPPGASPDASPDPAPHTATEEVRHDADAAVTGADDHLAAEGDPQVVYRYEVEIRGEVATGQEAFSETTARILTDARGWTLGGSVGFERDDSDRDFTVVLAAPDEVAAAHEECGPDYSCRVEDEIFINERNWRDATPAWREADGDLDTYRRYLINHEVGHFLGFGHVDCGGAGEQAPVMQQQSVSMQECEPQAWPLAWEREQLAQRLDVSVRD